MLNHRSDHRAAAQIRVASRSLLRTHNLIAGDLIAFGALLLQGGVRGASEANHRGDEGGNLYGQHRRHSPSVQRTLDVLQNFLCSL